MSQDIYVVIEHLRGQVTDISYTMLAAARELAPSVGGKVVAVLLGHNAKDLAKDFAADQVLYLDHALLADFTSDAYQKVLAELISKEQPRAVLFGNTSIGADVASVISMRLGLPLIGSCRSFTSNAKFISQICGGKIMAEGDLPLPTALDQNIPYVRVHNDDGSVTEYVDVESGFDASTLDESRLKTMDCITCHNRATHEFTMPTPRTTTSTAPRPSLGKNWKDSKPLCRQRESLMKTAR